MLNRCLAHIINLAMQALISTHSKSRHYNPADPNADLTSNDATHDTVGLVWAICVKVCCSVLPSSASNNIIKAHSFAKRKQLFADIQTHREMKPVRQLLIDMPVHWSSTYVITSCVESMSEVCHQIFATLPATYLPKNCWCFCLRDWAWWEGSCEASKNW